MYVIMLVVFIGVLMYSLLELIVDMAVGFNWKVPGEDKYFVEYAVEQIEKEQGIKKYIQTEHMCAVFRDILWIGFVILVIYSCIELI